MDYKNINDYELVYRVRENDDDAFNLIIRKYEPIICNYAKRYIGFVAKHGADMDDLVQIGRMAVAKAVRSYNSDNASIFYTYVTVCIERGFITYCRDLTTKKNRPLNYRVSDDYLCTVADNSTDPFNFVAEIDFSEYFLAIVRDKFRFVDCNIYELRYNGFSYKEIGELLDIPVSVVDSRLCKIRKTLQLIRDKF